MIINIYQTSSAFIIIALLRVFIARKKTLMIIIRLELILLLIFVNILMTLKTNHYRISPRFYILVLGACEASLVLRIIIILTRFKGNDMLTKNLMKY